MNDHPGGGQGLLELPPLPDGPLDVRAIYRTDQGPRPWTPDQIATLCVVDAVGLAIVLAGAWEAHSQHDTRGALAWFAAALLGLALSGTAHALWLIRARRAIALAIGLVTDSRRLSGVLHASTPSARPDEIADVVLVAGSKRYHRSDCAFAEGREVTQLASSEATSLGFRPCEVCLP
jgi:hypothetical protein